MADDDGIAAAQAENYRLRMTDAKDFLNEFTKQLIQRLQVTPKEIEETQEEHQLVFHCGWDEYVLIALPHAKLTFTHIAVYLKSTLFNASWDYQIEAHGRSSNEFWTDVDKVITSFFKIIEELMEPRVKHASKGT